jgi:sugar lactone lactonase YvrE
MDDNLYILDQGKINGSKAEEGSIKLIHYSLTTGKKIKDYIFNSSIADLENSFLNDIVIDTTKKRAYISDSGISIYGNLSYYKPGIIVLDLENPSNVYRILTKHKSVFPDETFWLHVNNTKVNEDNPMMTGADGLALSCDGSTLFYCPLTGRMIYSVLTSEIDKAIEKGDYNNITVYSAFKREASDGLLASSQNNLFMTGIETGSIHVNFETENDLLQFDHKDFKSLDGDETTMWPDTMAIHNHYLYFVSNQLNNFPNNIDYDNPRNKKYNFAILRFSVGNDNSYIQGCSEFGNSWGVGTIIVFVLFAIIILIVLSFVLMGSNNQEEVIDKHMNLGMMED